MEVAWRALLVPKYIYGLPKINTIFTIFTAAVAVLVPKYIYGQYLCEKANAGTAMWKLWRAGLGK